ncbi:MAG: adenosylcobinamide-GDP ribazoletransferase, partial [Nocardia sp.]|nr:adenosylcobinamide-GDP ribazoletransferase [Nocardia sp.]
GTGHWAAVVTAVGLGRVAVVAACRRGIEPAPDTWFGAMVAGTQSRPVVFGWVAAAVVVSAGAVPELPWAGPLITLVALAAAVRLAAHGVRRIGGLSGDLLGAAVELTTALAALGFAVAANTV